MPQPNVPPGLDSVRSGLAPFSAEQVALADLMTMARAVEHDSDGPTVAALEKLAALFLERGQRDPDWAQAIVRGYLTAALLEASRG